MYGTTAIHCVLEPVKEPQNTETAAGEQHTGLVLILHSPSYPTLSMPVISHSQLPTYWADDQLQT
jgi:hypothetical protein